MGAVLAHHVPQPRGDRVEVRVHLDPLGAGERRAVGRRVTAHLGTPTAGEELHRLVDALRGHPAIGGELAAGDDDEPVRRPLDAMLAAHRARLGVAW